MSDRNAKSATARGKIENTMTIRGYEIVWLRNGDGPKCNKIRNKITKQRARRLKILRKFYLNST